MRAPLMHGLPSMTLGSDVICDAAQPRCASWSIAYSNHAATLRHGGTQAELGNRRAASTPSTPLAYLRQRLAHRERLGVELELDDGGAAGLQRLGEGGGEIAARRHREALGAEAPGVGGEVRIDQRGGDDAARIFALLVRAD